jgi:hypothetical protein
MKLHCGTRERTKYDYAGFWHCPKGYAFFFAKFISEMVVHRHCTVNTINDASSPPSKQGSQ